MSKPWGGIGAWAADAEQAEAEERAAAAAAAPVSSFPSLKDGVTGKQKKKKMTLSEFYTTGGKDAPTSARLTPDEMMRLPTGPKERSAEEMQYGRLGGGFDRYGGGNRSGGGAGGGRSYGGGFDEDRRGGGGSRVSDFEPSRADGVDNWGAGKKAASFHLGDSSGDRPGRYGGGGGGIGGGSARADEVDNWAAGKRPVVPAPVFTRPGFGSGFRDPGLDSGPDSGRWSRGGASFHENNGQERTRLVLQPKSGGGSERNVSGGGGGEAGKTNKANPFGEARPREEVLAEKGVDWKKADADIEAKGISRPTSSQSSRPSSAQSHRSESVVKGAEGVVKAGPKVNPFGDAKPREVLLAEKGKDWRKVDLELERRVDRPETEEEKTLKEEIDQLKKGLEKEPNSQDSGPHPPNIQDIIAHKEKELEQLAHELNDKIRFGQKGIERPGSGAGSFGGSSDRPSSRPGLVDEQRSNEFMDRSRSRGTADVWSRSGDDRRSFQGGRERGFLGNRDSDRTRSRDRW